MMAVSKALQWTVKEKLHKTFSLDKLRQDKTLKVLDDTLELMGKVFLFGRHFEFQCFR